MTAADDAIKLIRTETARRKKIWAEIVAATREAYEAVEKEARRRNIPPRVWIQVHDPLPMTWLTCGGDYQLVLKILPNGKLSIRNSGRQNPSDMAYQGYPNLNDGLVEYYRGYAVKKLMSELNEFVIEQRTLRAEKKRK